MTGANLGANLGTWREMQFLNLKVCGADLNLLDVSCLQGLMQTCRQLFLSSCWLSILILSCRRLVLPRLRRGLRVDALHRPRCCHIHR